jgi:hypothetical protein
MLDSMCRSPIKTIASLLEMSRLLLMIITTVIVQTELGNQYAMVHGGWQGWVRTSVGGVLVLHGNPSDVSILPFAPPTMADPTQAKQPLRMHLAVDSSCISRQV